MFITENLDPYFDPYFDPFQEAMDHEAGCASEAQNVLAQSRALYPVPNESDKIKALHLEGKFVVARQYEVSCPHTDATLGWATVIVSVHATEAAAIEACGPQAEDEPTEGAPFVYSPPAPLPVTPAPAHAGDEIPF